MYNLKYNLIILGIIMSVNVIEVTSKKNLKNNDNTEQYTPDEFSSGVYFTCFQ